MSPCLERTRTLADDELEAEIARGLPGTTSIGRFTVLHPLGSGGMGTVYAAYDPQLDRKVALKLLHATARAEDDDSHARARLLREAQALAKVSHPNVIQVYEVGVVTLTGSERIFLAMELVEGPTLRAWIDTLQATERWSQGRAWQDFVDVMVQAGRGLAAAHAAGLMHRDFKPDNVLVGDDGLVRVLDFGLARRVGDDPPIAPASADTPAPVLDEPLTVTGAVLGTPAYMAPEQFLGKTVDERTDQFSFCVTLYEGLLGVRPFTSDSQLALAAAVMVCELPPWPSRPPVPDHLAEICTRGLSRSRADRFASMDVLVAALEVDHAKIRQRRMAWVGAGLALAAATAVSALVTQRVSSESAADAPTDPCASGPARVAERFGPTQIESLRGTLADPAVPYAVKTIDAVVSELERYASDWTLAYRDACEATHVRQEQSGALLDQRMACLDRRLSALDATVAELSRADKPSLLRSAVGITGSLPALETCANTTAMQGVEPPPDEATRDAVVAAQEQLDIASAKSAAYRYAEALEVVVAMGPDVEALGYRPLLAEYLLLRAQAEGQNDANETAVKSSLRAIMLGQSIGNDAIVRDAAARLSSLVGIRQAKPQEGLMWADFAEATAARVGWTDADRARLLRRRAWLLAEWGNSPEAVVVAQAALAAAERAFGSESLRITRVHSSLGSVYGRLGEYKLAEPQFHRVVALVSKHLGDEHPDLVNAYLNLGNTLSALGRLDEARECFDRSIALGETIPNVGLSVRSRTQSSLGNLLLNEQRWEEAIAPHEVALTLRIEMHGPQHPLVARSLSSLGNAYTHLDRDSDAVDAYTRSLAISEAVHDANSPKLAIALVNLGTHHVRHKRPGEAVPYLQRAHALYASQPLDKRSELEAMYWLGRARVEANDKRAEGLALVDAAIKELSELGEGRMLEEARQWRDAHP